MSTVWIVQNTKRRTGDGRLVPAHNTSPAEVFGERRTVLSDSVKPWAPDTAMDEMAETIADYDAEHDYLLLIGHPTFIGMVFALAADKAMADGHSHLKVLHWDRRDRTYAETRVPVDQLSPWSAAWENDDDGACIP